MHLFIIALGTTLFCLFMAYSAGRKKDRTSHFAWVAFSVASLVLTIFQVERLRANYILDPLLAKIHLGFVAVTVGLLVGVVVLGVWLIKNPSVRGKHRFAVKGFICSLIPTALTGIVLILIATPK